MKSMNRVFLMGYLGAEPEITISKTGKPYSRLSVATHRSWVTTGGDKREERTEWHSVFVHGALAERCCHNLRKGALVFVEGSLSYWKAAEKDYKNAIHGTDVKFLNRSAKLEGAHDVSSDQEFISEDASANSKAHEEIDLLDNLASSRNHNAVAHPA